MVQDHGVSPPGDFVGKHLPGASYVAPIMEQPSGGSEKRSYPPMNVTNPLDQALRRFI